MAYTAKQQAFYNAMFPLAQQASAETGIDANIIFAQAALETGWGASAPGGNYFGIKGAGQSLQTEEVINGKRVTITDSFRTYDSMKASVDGYAKFMSGKRYAGVRSGVDQEAQLNALQKSGYATAPNYSDSLRKIIKGMPDNPLFTKAQGMIDNALGGALSKVTEAANNAVKGMSGATDTIVENVTPFKWLRDLLSFNTAARATAVVIGVVLVALAIAVLLFTSDTAKQVKGMVTP